MTQQFPLILMLKVEEGTSQNGPAAHGLEFIGDVYSVFMFRITMKSTPPAFPHKTCSPANVTWLGDFEEIIFSLNFFLHLEEQPF